MSESTQTIQQAIDEIGYNPSDVFWTKTDAQQWSMIKAKRIEYAQRDAKNTLAPFVGTDAFSALPEEIQEAIKTIAVKRTGGGGGGARKNVFMDTLRGFLVKKGDTVDELEMFKATKLGRGEIKAKVRENLKNADPADRYWVQLDADAEAWVLIGKGEKQPAKWDSAPIDTPDEGGAEA